MSSERHPSLTFRGIVIHLYDCIQPVVEANLRSELVPPMSSVIHARLDADTNSLRDELQKQLGWTDSQIVREGIKALSALVRANGKRKIIGLGRFKSGITDLGSHKRHLKGFGK